MLVEYLLQKYSTPYHLLVFYSFRHTTLAIVVDLSKPSEIWFTLETLLAAAKARVENILTEMKQEYPGLKEKLCKKAWERVGEEHSVSTKDCIKTSNVKLLAINVLVIFSVL